MVAIFHHQLKWTKMWPMAANMCFLSDLKACTMLWFKMIILHWGQLMHTIHVCWGYQCTCCLWRVLCYINMLCSIANMFPKHNKFAYSYNTHYTFIIIIHSHIPKYALQLHYTQSKSIIPHVVPIFFNPQHNHKHGIIFSNYVHLPNNLQCLCIKYGG